jgi:hypothetical protein
MNFGIIKDVLHLLQSYDSELDLSIQDLEQIEDISEEEAKTIMVANVDYDEDNPNDNENISLYDLALNDDFNLIASNEYHG